MIDFASKSILLPLTDGKSISLPLADLYSAEARIREIATVNAHKAPELLATFNIAYLNLNDYLRQIELFLHQAKKALNGRKSIVLLDIVPQFLADRHLTGKSKSGSEDLRQAVLDQDQEYLRLADNVAQVEAILKLMEEKRKAFEMAFTSVKKILGQENNYNGLNQNRRLSVGSEVNANWSKDNG